MVFRGAMGTVSMRDCPHVHEYAHNYVIMVIMCMIPRTEGGENHGDFQDFGSIFGVMILIRHPKTPPNLVIIT